MSRRLVLWVIDEQHHAEQQVSEASVRKWMPDVDTRCFLAVKGITWYDQYIKVLQQSLSQEVQEGDKWYPYDQFLFLDSDTFLTEPVYDIFQVLDKYDIVSTRAPALQTTDMPEGHGIPDAYPEMNTGVLGYANRIWVKQLFEMWLEEYYAMLTTAKDNDQSALRSAMWKQGTKAWVMPNEYNFRVGFGAFAAGRVKILHLRSKDIVKAAEQVNEDTQMRVFPRGSIQ